ncbi:hypothetical protein HPP92_016839 [Vanilla planifolia]|uniref:CAP N-terminal domain-containing protein n=1 Tax=Vanilla planifolia TaxID=51239 RepID=A0A835QPH7_VANPL|nr:hypothetical protein HPP92_016839 [Vanilla planifolia]
MEKALVERLEAAVTRLETLAIGPQSLVSSGDLSLDLPQDPAVKAFDELLENYLRRVLAAAEKIGSQVLEASKITEHAFSVERELLIKAKQTQKPKLEDLAEFLKPLNELIIKANALTEGRRSELFNHLKANADSLSALVWIAYIGKDYGMSLPTPHVEESWQMAEFYNNKPYLLMPKTCGLGDLPEGLGFSLLSKLKLHLIVPAASTKGARFIPVKGVTGWAASGWQCMEVSPALEKASGIFSGGKTWEELSPGRCKPVRLIKIGPQNLAVRMNDACGRSDSSGGDSSCPTRSTTSSRVIRSAVGEPIYYPGSPSLLFLTVQWE